MKIFGDNRESNIFFSINVKVLLHIIGTFSKKNCPRHFVATFTTDYSLLIPSLATSGAWFIHWYTLTGLHTWLLLHKPLHRPFTIHAQYFQVQVGWCNLKYSENEYTQNLFWSNIDNISTFWFLLNDVMKHFAEFEKFFRESLSMIFC